MEKTIKEYEIVCGVSDSSELTRKVNEYIKDGWQPIGVVNIHYVTGYICFYQAMVKYEEVKNDVAPIEPIEYQAMPLTTYHTGNVEIKIKGRTRFN